MKIDEVEGGLAKFKVKLQYVTVKVNLEITTMVIGG